MALPEFWNGVRAAARVVGPERTPEASRLDPAAIERALRAGSQWLTPRAVAGFDEADFPFLPTAERHRLARLVKDFRRVASGVPPKTPATDDQVRRALPWFRDIVGLMGYDRHGDAEAYRIGRQIEREIEPDRPKELAELRFDTGPDHTGDPGIWIWAVLAEEDDDAFLAVASDARPQLDRASRAVAPELWPYISFRSVADQAELPEVEAR